MRGSEIDLRGCVGDFENVLDMEMRTEKLFEPNSRNEHRNRKLHHVILLAEEVAV